MKQKLLTVTVASALGLGAAGYAQAQALEGCKAYYTGQVLNIRLVNPVSNNLVTAIGGATAQGAVLGEIVNPDGFATPGSWNTATNTFDADPSCISDVGDVAVDQGFPCPPNNSFGQIPPFEDFGRADSLDVPGTSIAEGQPDVDIDGDDFTLVCAAQRSFTDELKSANGNSTNQVFAVRTFLADGEPDTQTLEWRGDYSGSAEAIVSAGTNGGTAAAISTANFEVERLSDGASIQCNTDDIEISAEVTVGPGTDGPVTVPAGTVIVCDAADFPAGTQQVFSPFQPDGVTPEQYDVSAAISCNANCTVFPPVDRGVHKWYFGKQASDRPADEPLMQPAGVVTLNDQFASRDVDVRFIRGLWNPAGKNADVDPARDDHHTCYEIVTLPGQGLQIFDVDIETANFGEDSFTLGLPKQLCISAAKTFNGVTEGSPVGTDYLCYTANSDAEGEFTLNDQFDDEVVNVTRLSRFCTPVGKNQPAPPTDPAEFDHLACYDFNEPIFDPFITVGVDDQFTIAQGFDPLTFWAEKPERFCEPARKIAATPRF